MNKIKKAIIWFDNYKSDLFYLLVIISVLILVVIADFALGHIISGVFLILLAMCLIAGIIVGLEIGIVWIWKRIIQWAKND